MSTQPNFPPLKMNRIEELRAKHEAAEKAVEVLRVELEEAEQEMARERLKNIEDYIPLYEMRLKRLKVYIETFVENERRSDAKYAFQKREQPYLNDFHEVTHDPLNWKIAEYNLLGMSVTMEIIFEYHPDAVKDFTRKGMAENVGRACDENAPEGFYGFRQ